MRGDKHEKMEVFFANVLHLGYKVVQRCLGRRILDFFDKHNWCYVLAWCSVIALPVPMGWTGFALLLMIPHELIRAVALWVYILTFAILAASKDYSEKSALDKALGA